MTTTNFENLRVYQLAKKLADKIWKIVIKWEYFARITVGKQIVTAADGVGSNIAEGSGRASPLDNRRFLKIVRGSLYETKHWFRRSHQRKLISDVEAQELRPLIDELIPSLNAYYRAVDRTVESKEQRSKIKGPRSNKSPDTHAAT